MWVSLINEDVIHPAAQVPWVLLHCEPELNSLNQASCQDLCLAGCKPRSSSCANHSDEQPGVVSQLGAGLPSSLPTHAPEVHIDSAERAPVCWVVQPSSAPWHLGARGHVHTDVHTHINVTQSLSKGGKFGLWCWLNPNLSTGFCIWYVVGGQVWCWTPTRLKGLIYHTRIFQKTLCSLKDYL